MADSKGIARFGFNIRKLSPKQLFIKRDMHLESLEKAAAEALVSPSQYDTVFSRRAVALDREIPNLMGDAVISSAVALLMETAFQVNPSQSIFRVQSRYDVIKKELDLFHEFIDVDTFILTLAFNLILYGNLPIKMWYNDKYMLERVSFDPDYSMLTPIIVSNQTLGFLKDGKFYEPFDYVYSQLIYYKDLQGTRSKYGTRIGNQEDGVMNEFVYAPSYLSAAYKPYKSIKIIEDALLMNRLDQSNYKRFIKVNVGDSVLAKNATKIYNFYKALVKKSRRVTFDSDGLMTSIGAGNEYEMILPKSSRQDVEVQEIGGQVEVKAIKDLEQMYKRLFAALGLQPSQIGFSEGEPSVIGSEAQFTVPEKRWARKTKTLVASVSKTLQQIDYYYLRSHGYDVGKDDWSYNFTSVSTLEEHEKRQALTAGIEAVTKVNELLTAFALPFDKKYLIKQTLADAFSNTSVDIEKLFDVDPELQAMNDAMAPGEGSAGESIAASRAVAWRNKVRDNAISICCSIGLMQRDEVEQEGGPINSQVEGEEGEISDPYSGVSINSRVSYADFQASPDIMAQAGASVVLEASEKVINKDDFRKASNKEALPVLSRLPLYTDKTEITADELCSGMQAPIENLYLTGDGFYLEGEDLLNYLYMVDVGVYDVPVNNVWKAK